jgi:hypothetical protein
MPGMKIRMFRLLTVTAAAAALALPAGGFAASQAPGVNRGVVQSVDAAHIVVKALDGTTGTFDLTAKTRVRLNGGSASLSDIGLGFVADVVVNGKGRVVLIRAFGTATQTDKGVVTTVTRASITITTGSATRTFALDGATLFNVRGHPGKRSAIRPGVFVEVRHTPDGPAQLVNVKPEA